MHNRMKWMKSVNGMFYLSIEWQNGKMYWECMNLIKINEWINNEIKMWWLEKNRYFWKKKKKKNKEQ